MQSYVPWLVFGVVIGAIFVADFFFINRNAHEIRVKESILATLGINLVAGLFGIYVLFLKGHEPMLQFFTGYLIEYSLSVDNLFVFMVLFSLFNVPPQYRHRVLFWGILFAIFARGLFIFGGVTLVTRFHWTVYLLGAFLVYTGLKLFFRKEEESNIMDNRFFRWLNRVIPLKKDICDECFTVRDDGKLYATPLLMCLIAIEIIDILFAFDSVPAILTISRDPFIIFTSNLFAILGLRSLYFALSGVMGLFRFLHYGLAVILVFIGVKILIEDWWTMPIAVALGTVAAVLAITVTISLLLPEKK
ncbi:MAG TPA: TerC/Alx family metal homeostasis membrane protein [bacterium]|nr:TerC/Alx family metal homeostasis membrane protein [bacterium]